MAAQFSEVVLSKTAVGWTLFRLDQCGSGKNQFTQACSFGIWNFVFRNIYYNCGLFVTSQSTRRKPQPNHKSLATFAHAQAHIQTQTVMRESMQSVAAPKTTRASGQVPQTCSKSMSMYGMEFITPCYRHLRSFLNGKGIHLSQLRYKTYKMSTYILQW